MFFINSHPELPTLSVSLNAMDSKWILHMKKNLVLGTLLGLLIKESYLNSHIILHGITWVDNRHNITGNPTVDR